MGEYRDIKKLLDKYKKTLDEVAVEILEELKTGCKNYREVERKLSVAEKNASYSNLDRELYESLFKKVRNLLSEEKNDLLIYVE